MDLRLQEELSSFSLLKNLENFFHDDAPLSAARSFDLSQYLPANLLKKVDMTTMAFGLEARVPFLDHRLVEHLLSIPAKQHMGVFSGKKILTPKTTISG